jgi:hypothetical protein
MRTKMNQIWQQTGNTERPFKYSQAFRFGGQKERAQGPLMHAHKPQIPAVECPPFLKKLGPVDCPSPTIKNDRRVLFHRERYQILEGLACGPNSPRGFRPQHSSSADLFDDRRIIAVPVVIPIQLD